MPNADTIDERVVEMRIDNRQFVKGANQTIGVLDKLKEALSFKKATKGFEDISRAANNINLGGLTTTLNEIEKKVEYLGSKAHMFIENLIQDLYNKGKRLLASLTSDQITAGWTKYENMTQAIHTIMGATADSWESTLERISRDYGFVGSQLDFVNQQLDRMLWFTDETSASFTDMTGNVGKWTNIGFELDAAAIAMMGVATWGYKAGAGINEQARAMYNLSQAAGMGKVTMIDWKSIENANMATMEFKNLVLEEAVAAGTLTKDINGLYHTIGKGTEINATNFRDSLDEGFFTSDVLMATLYKYGHFASLMQQVTEDTGLSTRDMMALVKDYKDGVFDAEEAVKELSKTYGRETPSVEALTYAMELLGKEEDDIGYSAFRASQETKTLTEAIEYTKDAVSSGWMKTWQYIVGDYEEAKELWTNVTDELYELFVAAGERRNAILSVWKDEGGRDALLEALKNVYNAIMNMIQPIRDAFKSVFGWGDDAENAGLKLVALTEKFRDWTAKLQISQETLEGMKNFFTKVFEKVKIVLGYAKKALSIFGQVFGYIGRIFGAFFRAFSSGSFDSQKFLAEMNDILGEIGEKLSNAWQKVKEFVDGLQDIPVVGPVLKFLINSLEKIWSIFGWIINKIKGVKTESDGVEGPWAKISKIFEKVRERFQGLQADGDKVKGVFQKIAEFFSALWEGLIGDPGTFKEKVKNFFKTALEGIGESLKEIDFGKLLEGAKIGILAYLATKLAGVFSSMKSGVDAIADIPKSIAGVFEGAKGVLDSYSKSINAKTYLTIAEAIGILAASIFLLSQIDENRFVMVALTLVAVFALLAKATKNLEKMKLFSDNEKGPQMIIKGFSKTALMIIAMAAFLAAAAYAIKTISVLSWGDMAKGLVAILAIVAIAVAAMWALNKMVTDDKGSVKSMLKLAVLASAIKAAGKAIARLAVLPLGGIILAAVAIGIVMAAMALVINQAVKIQNNGLQAMGVIAMLTLSIIALTIPLIALTLLATKYSGQLLWAAGIIGILMAIILIFLGVGAKVGEMPGLQKFALMLLVVAAAMVVLAIATMIFVPALAGLIAILFALIKTIMAFEENEFATITERLALLGLALLPLAAVLFIISGAALAFGIGILAAGLGVNFFVKAIFKFALSIYLVIAAIKMLVDLIVKIVQTVSDYGDKFIKVLEWVLLAVVGLLLGYKMYIANAALTIILAIITVIANVGGAELIETIRTILNKVFIFIGETIGLVVDFLVGFIVYVLKRLADALKANSDALAVQIERIIGIVLGLVVNIAMKLIGDVLQLLWGGIQDTINQMFGTHLDFNIGDTFSKIGKDVGNYITEQFDHSDEIENAGGTLDKQIADGVNDHGSSVTDAITGVITSGNQIVEDNNETNAVDLGGNFGLGIGEGIENSIPSVNGSVTMLTNSMTDTFANNLEIMSPSRVGASYGRYWDLGLALGIKDNVGEVENANNDLTSIMQTALMNAMMIVGRIADEDLSIKPVVKPVVDMTDISSANSMMTGMFGAYGDMNLGAINARVSEASSGASNAAASMDAFGEATASNDSFVINVYSQPGMDENDLANAVMYKIQNGILRKGAALG